MEDAEQRLLAPAAALAPGALHNGLVYEQAQTVGVRQQLSRLVTVLAHFFLDVVDLAAHLLVHVLDVWQLVQRTQAYNQAEQRRCGIQHQVGEAAPQLKFRVSGVAFGNGLRLRFVRGYLRIGCRSPGGGYWLFKVESSALTAALFSSVGVLLSFPMSLTPDRPELQFKPWEVARNVDAEAIRLAHARPGRVSSVQLEVAEARMEGQVAGRHG